MYHAQLRLLGPFQLDVASDSAVPLTAKKSQAMLCLLAASSGYTVPREKIASMLWTDMSDEFARTNLRQSIAVARRALKQSEHSILLNEGNAIRLDADRVYTDIWEFDQCLRDSTTHSLEHAYTLYRGELLEGIGLDDCLFREWLTSERHRFLQSYLRLCHRLLDDYREREQYQKAIDVAERTLSLEPCDEIAHQALMFCYQQTDLRQQAIRQYERCAQQLRNLLDADPSESTESLYQHILKETAKADRSAQTDELVVNTHTSSKTRPTARIAPFAMIPLMLVAILLFDYFKQTEVTTTSGVLTQLTNAADNQPTIAVLPFANLSKDPTREYFTDGLSEDLITDLSRIKGLSVIARSSSFTYRGPTDLRKVAEELDASIILQGSVRTVDDRIRINAQLIDAADGTQIWADRYDRRYSDLLAVQDEISRTIVEELELTLTQSEQARLDHILSVDPDAYDLFLTSLRPIREITKTGSAEARRILHKVLEMDSDFARAWSNLALTYSQDLNFGFAEHRAEWISLGFKYAERARSIDPDLPQLYFTLSGLHLANKSYDKALEAALKSIQLDPNYADGFGTVSQILTFAGEPKNAGIALERAKKLNPKFTFTYLWMDAQIHFLSRNFNSAAVVFNEINQRNPAFVNSRLMLISMYGHLGRKEDAEWEIAELLTARPEFSLEQERENALYKQQRDVDFYIEGLRKAGL